MTWQFLRNAYFWIIFEKQICSIFDSSMFLLSHLARLLQKREKKSAAEVSECQIPQPSPSARPDPILQWISEAPPFQVLLHEPHPVLSSPTAVPPARGWFLLGQNHVVPYERLKTVRGSTFSRTEQAAKVGACTPVSMETRCVPCLQNKQWYLFNPVWAVRQDIVYVGVHRAPRALKR